MKEDDASESSCFDNYRDNFRIALLAIVLLAIVIAERIFEVLMK
jgi:hypothetical protein